jgi:hypothetical protein
VQEIISNSKQLECVQFDNLMLNVTDHVMIEIMAGAETAFLTPENARNNCMKHLSAYYRENMAGLKLYELYKACQQKVMHCIE